MSSYQCLHSMSSVLLQPVSLHQWLHLRFKFLVLWCPCLEAVFSTKALPTALLLHRGNSLLRPTAFVSSEAVLITLRYPS